MKAEKPGCRFMKLGNIEIWMCNPWESYMRSIEIESQQMWEQHELDLDLERQQEIVNETPIKVEPQVIPYKAISDWSAYNEG